MAQGELILSDGTNSVTLQAYFGRVNITPIVQTTEFENIPVEIEDGAKYIINPRIRVMIRADNVWLSSRDDEEKLIDIWSNTTGSTAITVTLQDDYHTYSFDGTTTDTIYDRILQKMKFVSMPQFSYYTPTKRAVSFELLEERG